MLVRESRTSSANGAARRAGMSGSRRDETRHGRVVVTVQGTKVNRVDRSASRTADPQESRLFSAKLLTRDEARRIAVNQWRLRAAGAKTSPIMRMICRPTIAMGDFVSSVSGNRCFFIVW
jgi:hypothetical protein